MKTILDFDDELRLALDPMENDYLAIIEYAGMLVVLTAGPDAETALDGMHNVRDQGPHRKFKETA